MARIVCSPRSWWTTRQEKHLPECVSTNSFTPNSTMLCVGGRGGVDKWTAGLTSLCRKPSVLHSAPLTACYIMLLRVQQAELVDLDCIYYTQDGFTTLVFTTQTKRPDLLGPKKVPSLCSLWSGKGTGQEPREWIHICSSFMLLSIILPCVFAML